MYIARNLEDALSTPNETGELYLGGRGLTDFPTEIFQLPNLKVLDLSGNLIRSLPEGIGGLSGLEVLNLRANQLRELPGSIGGLLRLSRLDLEENQLASLPPELRSCDGLRVLRLSDNAFSEWPEAALAPHIESLTLAHNALASLPPTVRMLRELHYLDLRHNRLQRLPDDLVLVEGLNQVLLQGNPLALSWQATDPEAVIERFFKDVHVPPGRGRTTAKFTPQTRRCWLRMLLGGTGLLEDFPLALCLEALDSTMPVVRSGARAVLPQVLPSPLPASGPADVHFAGQIEPRLKAEALKAFAKAGIRVVRRLHPAAAIVLLGERPGPIALEALERGHPLAFEGHLEAWLAAQRGEFLQAHTAANPMRDNLLRLLRSPKRENIELALVLLGRSGMQAEAASEVLGVRLFHSDQELRQRAWEAYKEIAEKATRAFVERQVAQHFRDDEPFDERALISGLMRNPAVDGGALVGAAMRLRGSSPALVMLLPEDARAAFYPEMMQEGQLNLASMGLERIPPTVLGQSGLKYLMLGRNALQELPEELETWAGLEILDLSENHLTALPDGIAALRALTGLDLSQNRLRALPEAIAGLRGLEALRLDRNPLGGLPEALMGLPRLEMLGLYGCRLGGVPEVVWRLRGLKALDLGDNGLKDLPEAIGDFPLLESLSLKDNPLMALPEAVGSLERLRFLDLSLTPLRQLPVSLTGHARIERIYLIQDAAMDWEQVLPVLASMPGLRYVYLKGRSLVRAVQLRIEDGLRRVRVVWS